MSGFFSKLSKSRHRETGADPSHPPPASTDTTRPSSPASTSNTNASLKAPKSGLRQAIRDRFSSNNQTPKEQEQPHPPTVAPESETLSLNEVPPETPENPSQDEPLQSERLNIELPEDPHHQRKVDAIEYSIQAISLFEDLSKVISLVLPDALGQVLGKITDILTLLKVGFYCMSLQ
ncbi:hypothetical protein M408DRAFT_23757 [Serendipita vermifera MAFF 305830]|uniref:Uncharacterized protein n=1 Tax=Serendipita vermifera MAFF 305830 TaxID=933852 RepID=A0A0C2WQ89_SERVB|nr:hypothetical protein M408DRAFT_23757 [Serendipita vermifera MAFF 305830]